MGDQLPGTDRGGGLLPGLNASSPWELVAAAAVTGIFGIVIRPVLVVVATAIGWLAVALLAITGQAVAMHVALLRPARRRGDLFLDPGGRDLDRRRDQHRS